MGYWSLWKMGSLKETEWLLWLKDASLIDNPETSVRRIDSIYNGKRKFRVAGETVEQKISLIGLASNLTHRSGALVVFNSRRASAA